MIELGVARTFTQAQPRKRASQQPIVIDGGSGRGLRIDTDGAGQIFDLDYYYLSRWILEHCPTIAVCSAIIQRLFQSLRLELQRSTGRAVKRHPLLDLFNTRPNEVHSPTEFWGQMAEELVFGGECIVRVYWGGVPEAGLPAAPRRMVIWPYDEVREFSPTAWDGSLAMAGMSTYQYEGATVTVDPDNPRPEIMHVRMSVNTHRPLRSLSPWRGLESEILASTNASRYRAEYFRQGGSPRLVATIDPMDESKGEPPSPDDIKASLEAFFRAAKAGPSTWGGAARALPEGVKPLDLGTKSTTDPVLTAALRGVDEKIAAVAGIPVIALNNLERATYSNARQQMALLVRDAVRPRLSALISAIKRDLLMPMAGRNATLMPVIDTDTLVQDEAVVYNKIVLERLKHGVIDENEAREAFDMEPREDLEALGQMDDEDEGRPPGVVDSEGDGDDAK